MALVTTPGAANANSYASVDEFKVYRVNRLPANPVLEWRVLGMDRLWQKHKTPRQHRRWRRQAKFLLRLRALTARRPRNEELRRLASKLA